MLPYFKRTERRLGVHDAQYRGGEGGLPVTDIDWIHPICEAFIDGAAGMGIPRCEDYNARSQEGVGYFQRAIRNGYRRTSYRDRWADAGARHPRRGGERTGPAHRRR